MPTLPDGFGCIADLIAHGVTLVIVKTMPRDLGGWCLDDTTLYLEADSPFTAVNRSLREAAGHVPPGRGPLIVIDGGKVDEPVERRWAGGSR